MKKLLFFCSISLFALSCQKPETATPLPLPTPTPTPTPTPKNAAKEVLSFTFSALNPVVTAAIGASPKTISVSVPYGTDRTKLVPTITVSDKATVSPATGIVQDFSQAITYTVTAEDGTKQTYPATVAVAAFSGGEYKLLAETINRFLVSSTSSPYFALQATNLLNTDGREHWQLEPTLFVTPTGLSIYTIQNKSTRFYLRGKGNELTIAFDKGDSGATWTVEPTQTGDSFYIRNRASGYVLVADAQGFRLLTNGGFANERWKLTR